MIFFCRQRKNRGFTWSSYVIFGKRATKSGNTVIQKNCKAGTKKYYSFIQPGPSTKPIKKYQDAITCFDKVIEINPDDIGSINNRGISLAELGNTDDAFEYYNKAIEIDPKYAAAHYNKGVLYDKLLQHEEAIESLDEALKCRFRK